MTATSADGAKLSAPQIRRILIGVLIPAFLASLDQTIVAAALPVIGRELTAAWSVTWIVSSYMLAFTAALPIFGKLSDVYGRRAMMLGAIVVFAIGSLGAAMALSMPALVAARAVQGLGGAGLTLLARAVLGDIASPADRGRYQPYFTIVFVTAGLLGPPLGGLVSQYLHWSVIFWLNLPLLIVGFVMSWRLLPDFCYEGKDQSIDYLGALLLAAAALSLMLTIDSESAFEIGVSRWWLGLLTTIAWALAIARLHTATHPIIPTRVLWQPIILAATLATCTTWATFFALIVVVPLFLQNVRGLSASDAGFVMLPMSACLSVGALVSGQAIARLKHYKFVPVIGLIGATVAAVAIGMMPRMCLLALGSLLAVISLGAGSLFTAMMVNVLNSAERRDIGSSTGLLLFSRQLCAALAITAAGTWIYASSATSGVLNSTWPFQQVFAVAGAGFAGALLLTLLIKEQPLRTY